jgi:uncharacterized protein (TIGR02680 family)
MSTPLSTLRGGEALVRPRLPSPVKERWQPLRLGLVNLYRFDDETFAFEDGRLLLRGNNGTGKSRVLALTLPFLFDGRIEPHRVEPDGDSAKRMEWNLLLGRHDDRLGYTWLELGRMARSPDGGTPPEARYITIGCGMRASAGRGAPRTWFFVTERRVGDDLRLIAETGQALTRERLVEAIGERGHVVETATEYRRLVDRALFNLGEHRYGALIDLLIQLRRPQLSRQLDESLLSDALSEALPPLPPAVIADVADAFRALDDDRDQLDGFRAALQATSTFLSYYRSYAGVASRRRATALTQAHARYERTRGELRDAERARDEAAGEVARLEAQRDEFQRLERAAGVQVHTLETSPEMRAARELDAARVRAAELARAAEERAADLRRAGEELDRREGGLERAEVDAGRTRNAAGDAVNRAADAADAATLASAHAGALDPLGLPDARDADALAAARRELEKSVARTRAAAEHLLALEGDVGSATAALAAARERLDERSAELDRARDQAADREAALAAERQEAAAALLAWATELVELAGFPTDAVAAALAAWDATGAAPIAAAADAAQAEARERYTREAAGLDAAGRELDAERAGIVAEQEALAAGVHRPPPAPHTRLPAARDGRAGAPLWELVEAAGGVEPATIAGYEAALEAAGLLDAWVTPDGALLDADDTVLLSAGIAPRADGGLTRVLVPAPAAEGAGGAKVPAAHVASILAGIGAGEDGDVWVAADGRWRLGPLHGRWRKPAAEHIGRAARERARARRLAELEAQLAALEERRAGLGEARAELERRMATAVRERSQAPAEDGIREAVYAATHAMAEVHPHRVRVAEAETAARERHEALDRTTAARDEAAADLGLAGRAADPGRLLREVDAYRTALAELWAALATHGAALRRLDDARAERDGAAAERERRAQQAGAAAGAAADAATRRDTLEDAVGSTAAEVMQRLEEARARQKSLAQQLVEVGAARETQLLAHERAATRADEAAARLQEQAGERAEEVKRFRRLVRAGFLGTANVAVEGEPPAGDTTWAPEPAVRAARRVNEALDAVRAEDSDWERVQRGLLEHYTTLEHALLPHTLQPTATLDDDLFVVTASFQGRAASIPQLRDLLHDEVLHRQSVLDAREREVLENHLVGEVATQLHELIRQGEALVAAMNDELAVRPTSTGMRLRFVWRPRPDGPDALADARRRLLAADHVWSAEDRDALGRFLQARIREVRDVEASRSWQEQLTEALDYRRWHLFAVEREQEGKWVRLTRRTHGTSSGGEKALALTVPQFAAAAAHYRSAGEHAPRLIALDEAFVGIDSDMRAKCMDLLVHFDLDVAMTSEREWACYPTVPAIAIHQLATRPGIDAIGVHRWVWTGRDRVQVRVEEAGRP